MSNDIVSSVRTIVADHRNRPSRVMSTISFAAIR